MIYGTPCTDYKKWFIVKIIFEFGRLSLDDDIWFRPWKYDEEDVLLPQVTSQLERENIISFILDSNLSW